MKIVSILNEQGSIAPLSMNNMEYSPDLCNSQEGTYTCTYGDSP